MTIFGQIPERYKWGEIGFLSISALVYFYLGLSSAIAKKEGSASLHVTILGLRSDKGDVHIALYDNPVNFPDPNGMILDVEVPIYQKKAHYSFTDLTQKDYAIAIYHDENNNDSFDQNFFGIPLEDYAFSNNASVFFRPPSFSDASFQLLGPRNISIRIAD